MWQTPQKLANMLTLHYIENRGQLQQTKKWTPVSVIFYCHQMNCHCGRLALFQPRLKHLKVQVYSFHSVSPGRFYSSCWWDNNSVRVKKYFKSGRMTTVHVCTCCPTQIKTCVPKIANSSTCVEHSVRRSQGGERHNSAYTKKKEARRWTRLMRDAASMRAWHGWTTGGGGGCD